MLKIRIIPTLLWKNIGLVKGVKFDSWRRIGSVLPAIKVYNMREVDELILLDITATKESRLPDFDTISEISPECFIPFTVGGGIKKIEDIKTLLRCGADKVSINSATYKFPELISKASKLFGTQCIIVSIDVKKTPLGYICFSHAGTKSTGIEVTKWVKEMEKRGAGEILVTSIERDGTMKGYDLELLKKVTSNVKIPVIASGGAGSYEDMYKAVSQAKVSAIAAASIFHFTEQTPLEAREYLSRKGISIRRTMF